MTEKTLIAYHTNCGDGQVAAFVAWKFTGRKSPTVPVNYDLHKKSFQEVLGYLTRGLQMGEDLSTYTLMVVDFSFPYEFLKKLGGVFGEVVVIDHHKTAKDDLEALVEVGTILKPDCNYREDANSTKFLYTIQANVHVHFCQEESGALMTWRHFMGENTPVADFVRYTSDRDLWKFLDPNTRPFTAGMNLHRNASWQELEHVFDNPSTVIANGRVVEALKAERIRSTLKNSARLLRAEVDEVGVFQVACYNAPADITSDLLSTYLNVPGNHPIGMTYTIGSDDMVYCSMRSTPEFDCSAIAKLLGGGGHAQACGFTIPLKRFVEILESKNLTGMYPHPSKQWSYHRYGSEPMKGYTLLAGGSPIAYLGDGEMAEKIVGEVCAAHNATL